MGFLGGLIKGIGKVAGSVGKKALSRATGGVSDVVLSKLKGRGVAKRVASGKLTSSQEAALVNKIQLAAPRVRRTEQVLSDAVEGGTFGTPKKKRAGKGGSTGKRRLVEAGPSLSVAAARPKKKAAKKAARPKKAKGKRSAPSGGLDLKTISAMWKEQGKPGTWIDFIKANSDVRLQ